MIQMTGLHVFDLFDLLLSSQIYSSSGRISGNETEAIMSAPVFRQASLYFVHCAKSISDSDAISAELFRQCNAVLTSPHSSI